MDTDYLRKKKNYNLRKNSAFSLVELLIVISIIGILAAIVIPEFQDQSGKAKESAAKDNLRIFRQSLEILKTDPTAENIIDEPPENPFNGLNTVVNPGTENFPAEATGNYGWIYIPSINQVRLDWPGTDSEGIRYYDY